MEERDAGRGRARIARYVAIITDGNGRWAQQRGLPVWEGHRAGAETVRACLRDAVELGIEELTIYAFSTENWARSDDEVGALMGLMTLYLEQETPRLHTEGVRIRVIGRRSAPVPADVLRAIEWAEQLTAANRRITLYIPFNYGGRAEIVDAARRFADGGEEEFRALLYAPDMHDPEVVIRTGGEQRLSNYLLWQLADATLVVRPELWPDFDRAALQAAATLPGRR
ncbi:polyprenyl diphosphate synthase [Conexibacter stalactiti]|uniref:Isoprenyl transferase n=1 Tax=Conexibacter stalactiti TaxID=1940611 RepID=A0ABU4HXJ7_9ACTN|nr:polyprenyl diphosphate synthase [Conexibacter stalactiti]MDW5597894.1 polyprenyl diphosphate synthase [Conexibacter stalactiti]MEC5038536.1 polyprenyl diphosphate synthase [Conexibacter stalactiti]